jgi:hypothetical protein
MSIDAMKQALEALEEIHPGNMTPMAEEAWNKAIATLRLAIEQAERQEHSIEIRVYGQTVTFVTREPMAHYKDGDRFYRTPPQRQPLTDAEIWRQYQSLWPFHPQEEPRLAADMATFARAIERAHGIGGGE